MATDNPTEYTPVQEEKAVVPVEFYNKKIPELVSTLTWTKPIKNKKNIDIHKLNSQYKDLTLLLCRHFNKDISLILDNLVNNLVTPTRIFEKTKLLLSLFPQLSYEQIIHSFMIKILVNTDKQTIIQIKKDGVELDEIILPNNIMSWDWFDEYIKQIPYQSRDKIFNQVLSYMYITNNLGETCPEVHKGMQVSLLDASWIVLKWKNAISYTKAERLVHSSLFKIDGKRSKFGFLSDLYQDITGKANKKIEDMRQQHGFPLDKTWQQKLIEYIKTIHPWLVTDVSFHNWFCVISLAWDITYKDNDDDAIQLDRRYIDDKDAKEMFALANKKLDISLSNNNWEIASKKEIRILCSNAESMYNAFNVKTMDTMDTNFDALWYIDDNGTFQSMNLPTYMIENFKEKVLTADPAMMNDEEKGYDCHWFVKSMYGQKEYNKRIKETWSQVHETELKTWDLIKFFKFSEKTRNMDSHSAIYGKDNYFLSKGWIWEDIVLATFESLAKSYGEAYVFREKW